MTAMQTIKGLIQGSDEWKEFREEFLVASEAPVIMGDSEHMTRTELLNLKTTGDEKEINEWVEKFIFAKGHEYEAGARPIAEGRLGQELYPITGVREIHGLKLLASFDGATMFEDDSWEHKTLNAKLRAVFEEGSELPLMYVWQLEHQMLVLGTDSCIFSASLGDEETYREIRYQSLPGRREQLIEGWKLFMKDLESHQVKVYEPELVGRAPGDLPALRVEVTGMVTASNLREFKQVAMDVFGSINTELNTDEDFANAEKTVKWCSTVEERLEATKQNALAQTASIDELFRTMDDLREEARQIRLNLSKKVDSRKKERKVEIAQAAKAQFDEHIKVLNKALGGDWMPHIPTDFNAAMKGKRTIATLESAANDELARARIEANRIGNRIEANLEMFDAETEGYEFLFADKKALVIGYDKEPLTAMVKQRIADHKAAEEAKERAEREKREAEEERQRQAEEAEANQKQEAAQPQATTADGVGRENQEGEAEVPRTTEELAEPVQQELPTGRSTTAMPARRPPDDRIIEVLTSHYQVDAKTVIGWLQTMNLEAAEKRLTKAA